MSDIAFAVRHYYRRHGHMPEDFADSKGDTLSWRVRFLPDLAAGGYFKDVGVADGEPLHSAAAAESTAPSCYYCYHRRPYCTYFAIRGGGAAWPTDKESPPKVWDYDRDVALLIEAPSEIHGEWYDPRDLSFEDAVELLTTSPDVSHASHWAPETLFSHPASLCNVAFLDGSVRTLRLPLSERDARLILKAKQVPYNKRQILSTAEQSMFKRDKVAAWIAFVSLAFGPVFMARGNRIRIDAEPLAT